MTACMKIHDGTVLKKEPALHGMLDTLTSQFKTKTLTKKILVTKDYLTNNIKKNVLASWSKDYCLSRENKLGSLNLYYCHNVLEKRNYLSLKQATLGNSKLPNFVLYKMLFKEIGSIDIGKLCKINEHLGIKQEKVGLGHQQNISFTHLASFYLIVNLI